MSNTVRLGLSAAAAVLAVIAFLVLKPEESSKKADDPSTSMGDDGSRPPARRSPAERIVLRGGAPRGGVARIEASRGDMVRLVVSSDTRDQIHLHGYDLERRLAPGAPARFRFTARLEGEFEIESHEAEDAGRDALIGRLVVEP